MTGPRVARLVLASRSATRQAMLQAAGVPFEAVSAGVDEEAAKEALRAEGVAPRDFADALAELKARKVASRSTGALVLGGDSIVVLQDGTILDKPDSRAQAAEHLAAMSATRIDLFSAAVVAENGAPVWRHVDHARLWVRPLSPEFVNRYLDLEWPAIADCVGCFRIEGPGVQLFARIEGSQFTILGMPLLPILDYLRTRGVMPS